MANTCINYLETIEDSDSSFMGELHAKCEERFCEATLSSDDKGKLFVAFETKWTEDLTVITEISSLLREYTLKYSFYEPSFSLAGHALIKNGVVESEHFADSDDSQGYIRYLISERFEDTGSYIECDGKLYPEYFMDCINGSPTYETGGINLPRYRIISDDDVVIILDKEILMEVVNKMDGIYICVNSDFKKIKININEMSYIDGEK